MIDHAALVELHLLDRIVFTCDKSVPAVIYKVSEESFAGVLNSDIISGVCVVGNALEVLKYGIRDRKGGLCEKGVRLILEIRDSTVRVPLKPRTDAGLHELQVPVQRVSYGGMPEKMFQQSLHKNQASHENQSSS
ncbi:hypothetical protein OSTOST_16657 [Ostertagia ostertagi]